MSTRTPHDALFRAAFSRKENAVGELRAVLPRDLARRIDWATLHLEDGHFVDAELTGRQSDLLYTASCDGREIAVYVLFEHQSSAEPLMPYRLLRYMVRIWDRWLADHDRARSLPAIVPVVLSHVEGGFREPTSMAELYDLPADLRDIAMPHLPSFRFILDDLARVSDDELRSRALHALGMLALLLLRSARSDREFPQRLSQWADALLACWRAPDGRETIATLVRYLALVNDSTTLQDISAVLVPVLGDDVREVIMTEGQRLIEQGRTLGRTEGRAEGRAEGRTEGRAEGEARALLAILAARSLAVSDDLRQRVLACTDVATLDKWIARAATATSADDALSDG